MYIIGAEVNKVNESYKEYTRRRQKEQRREERKKRGSPASRFITSLAAVIFTVFCLGSFVLSNAEMYEKKQELEALKKKAAELEAKNDEYSSILAEEDERAYMERIAVDVLGYAYPNERRFYDTTRN